MARTLYKYIKEFDLSNASLTFNDRTKIHVIDNLKYVELKKQANGKYPLDTGIYFKTAVTTPNAIRKWEIFSPSITDEEGLTSVRFRLSNGTNQYWWNGTAWVVDVTHWNTLTEVTTNFPSFPVTSRKLQVFCNLTTTDEDYTPRVYNIKILGGFALDVYDDLIYRSFVPLLKTIRVFGSLRFEVPSGPTTTLSLNFSRNPYNITDVDCVYFENDSTETDLFSSYNSTTKTVTLTTSVDQGDVLIVVFQHAPDVSRMTNADYDVEPKIPSINIEAELTDEQKTFGQRNSIYDMVNKVHWKAPQVEIKDMAFEISALTALGSEQKKMTSAIKKFFNENKLLTSYGLDDKIDMELSPIERVVNTPNLSNIFDVRFIVTLRNVPMWLGDMEQKFSVETFEPTLEKAELELETD